MADIMSKDERSERMSRIRSKDTKPELLVRKELWRAGFRYRLHAKELPGRPDLVLPRLQTAVFVHGCYWHGHCCQKGRIPRANSGFWAEKFAKNKLRDARNRARLRRLGWKVIVVWECTLYARGKRERTLAKLVEKLRGASRTNLESRP